MEIYLEENEAETLKEILENDLSDLSMEITGTDRKDYREKLKDKRHIIYKILKSVREIPEADSDYFISLI
jgi:hypothetical protein